MADLLQLLIAGLATGGVYALAAIGFTLLWQISQTVNFAQGEFVMLPAFFVLFAMNVLGLPFAVAALVGIAVSVFVLGFLFKRAVVDQTIRHGAWPLVISSIAFALFLKEGVGRYRVGTDALEFGPGLSEHNIINLSGHSFQAHGARLRAPGSCVYITGYTPLRKVITIRAV